MSTYITAKFTVLRREVSPTANDSQNSVRSKISKGATKDGKSKYNILNEDSKLVYSQDVEKQQVEVKAGETEQEMVTGATWRWELKFNNKYRIFKDVLTRKELFVLQHMLVPDAEISSVMQMGKYASTTDSVEFEIKTAAIRSTLSSRSMSGLMFKDSLHDTHLTLTGDLDENYSTNWTTALTSKLPTGISIS